MKYSTALVILCVSFVATACSAFASSAPVSMNDKLPVNPDLPVSVAIDSGTILLTNGRDEFVEITGETFLPGRGEYSAIAAKDGIHIVARVGKGSFLKPASTPAHLQISVPTGAVVKFDSFDGDIELRDFSGEVTVTTVAGDVRAVKSSGKLVFKSNRGNVTVRDSQGEIHLVGNYGLLDLENCAGKLDASTIMGTIRYTGKVRETDQVQLETDHGPVEAFLAMDSDISAKISTTSGVVDCVVPGFALQGNGCLGVLGNGGGTLKIRTVSGNVNLQRIP